MIHLLLRYNLGAVLFPVTCRRFAHTIYALSSGRGVSGVALVRISGQSARLALTSLAGFSHENAAKPRHAYVRRIVNPISGQLIDRGLVLFFPGPASFTGEDIVEFHVHGGPGLTKALFQALLTLPGYRMAEPGEFMRRSFNNGKIDLTGVEAVSDLISAETEAQHALAIGQLDKTEERQQMFASWRQSILQAVASVEAWIDFSEVDNIENDVIYQARAEMAELAGKIRQRLSDARRGQRLRDGLKVAIVGPPNAGKSSLMNILCRDDDVSIVSSIAGTTRDAIERPCDIAGYPIILVDTAGLHTGSEDPIEQIGVVRSQSRAKTADIIVFVLDASQISTKDFDRLTDSDWLESVISETLKIPKQEDTDKKIIVVFNKLDLLPEEARKKFPIHEDIYMDGIKHSGVVCSMSCVTRFRFDSFLSTVGAISEELCSVNAINQIETSEAGEAATLIGGLRQREYLNRTADLLQTFVDSPFYMDDDNKEAHTADCDFVASAEILRLAVRELGKLTGEITTEQMLDKIFRTFCVGK